MIPKKQRLFLQLAENLSVGGKCRRAEYLAIIYCPLPQNTALHGRIPPSPGIIIYRPLRGSYGPTRGGSPPFITLHRYPVEAGHTCKGLLLEEVRGSGGGALPATRVNAKAYCYRNRGEGCIGALTGKAARL